MKRDVSTLIVGLLLTVTMAGCSQSATNRRAQDLEALTKALNERNVSHCLFARGTLGGTFQGLLTAKTGELDCEAQWKALLQIGL